MDFFNIRYKYKLKHKFKKDKILIKILYLFILFIKERTNNSILLAYNNLLL